MLRLLMLTFVLSLGAAGPAFALGPSSTMADWSAASPADREALLEAIGPRLSHAFNANKTAIMACIDLAGQAEAHADLLVSDIAEACAEEADPNRETSPSTDT